MKVLFIARSFAPDNVIAAKRITMLVKYLHKLGHEITVIRSGKVFGKAEMSNLEGLEGVDIYSYERTHAEHDICEKRDDTQNIIDENNDTRKLNQRLSFCINIGHILLDPIIYSKKEGRTIRDKIISLYNKTDSIRGYDVIISSFTPLGCIQAAKYIREKEKAAWIIDFRDLMDNMNYTAINRYVNSIRQKHFVENADACLCVSEGNKNRLIAQNKTVNAHKIFTVYNGYENSTSFAVHSTRADDQSVHICYTGTLFGGKRNCSPLFKVLKSIKSIFPVTIDYAGRDYETIKNQAKEYGLENVVINHGFLSRTEVTNLQAESDIFLVLSWNTKHDQGILTGKFYEALQHKKPIIALVEGDTPDSELKILIDRYHLGICYEEATKERSEQLLQNYLEKQILKKQCKEKMEYEPDESVFSRFQYKEIAKQLEQIIISTIVK